MSTSILSRHELAGPYRILPTRRAALQVEAAALGYPVHAISPENAASTAEWLRALGHTLGFPAHFGANFDALYDSLCDKEIIDLPACVLLIEQVVPLGEAGCDTLIAVLQAVADEWREQGRLFWALFSAPGVDLDPLPAK